MNTRRNEALVLIFLIATSTLTQARQIPSRHTNAKIEVKHQDSSIQLFFLRKVVRQSHTHVTSFCVHFKRVGCELLREAFWSEGGSLLNECSILFLNRSHDNISLVILNNKMLEHWRLKVLFIRAFANQGFIEVCRHIFITKLTPFNVPQKYHFLFHRFWNKL